MENCEESTSSGNLFTIPGYQDANSYCGAAFRSILAATKASNELPSDSDFDYYSTFKGFQKVMQSKGQSILSLMTSLIEGQSIEDQFQGKTLEDKFELLENVNEVILDNISSCIDEACGVKKKDKELFKTVVSFDKKSKKVITTSWNKKEFDSSSPGLVVAKDISRPQLFFKDKIDNSNAPFIPLIKEKPNSIKPLAITLEKYDDIEEYCHPYEWEIEKFTVPEALLEEVQPIEARPLEETPLVFVKTEEQLRKLCEELLQQKEFAVDLEHHSYRSFQGFTCLMQISTRETDYIIDAIGLRSELHLLNQSFTDPKIVKVFHGADMDIVWLQKDFGVYIVNLFDTGQAARVLHLSHLSLSFLLKRYCNIEVDKQYQLADWRVRPLPDDMITYARQDTHYLLYIYDCIKNDLIKNGNETKNLVRSVFERSRMISLKKYEKLIFTDDKYLEVYQKSRQTLNIRQLYCLKELYSWRDKVARETDESLAYVLPNHMMLRIAESLPKDQQGVLACCNPIPPPVKQQLNEIHSIVLNAIRSSTAQLVTKQLQQKARSVKMNKRKDLTACPHDLLHFNQKKIQSSNSSNLSTSLPIITKDCPVTISSKPPSLTALFDNFPEKNQSTTLDKVSEKLSKLYSPFQRYKMTEKLQIDSETKFNAVPKSSNKKQMSEIAKRTHQSQQEASEDNIDDNDISEDRNTTADLNRPGTSKANFSSTPLRKKSKKKKRKAQPDLSLNCTPINQGPPPKKSKTPEAVVIEEANNKFVPYDYSKADLSSFSGKKKSKNVFKPGTDHNFKAPGKHHGRSKKHFKQETFGNKNIQEKKKWPQNK